MIKNLTRGGQTFLHTYHMIRKIVSVLLLWFFFLLFIVNGIWIYYKTYFYDYYFIAKLFQAWGLKLASYFYTELGFRELAYKVQWMHLQTQSGITVKVFANDLLTQHSTFLFLQHLKHLLMVGCIISTLIALSIVITLGVFLFKRGKKIGQEKHLRGSEILESGQLKKALVNSGHASDLNIAGIPLPKHSEIQHILITGTTGAGKTVCMSELLSQIRKKRQRAIVYDHMGVYTQRFYRADQDILLNPLDQRGAHWNIWSECKIDSHYDAMAESLMPMPTKGQDPFWVMAARVMFAVAARRLKQMNEISTERLLRYLLMSDLNRIQELIANSEAESLASEKMEKLAISVKAVLSTYLRSLRYLPDAEKSFSIRDWVLEEEKDSWIFITSREDQHATLKPLISTWLDIAANAILTLPRNLERRIYLAIDETDSLQTMPSLLQFVTKSRQRGGCGILSIQAISQFYKNFGEEDAETIISNCNTGIHFRSRGKKTSAYVAELLGEKEIQEINENISYGGNQVKDGVSLSPHKTIKNIILPSQIKQLNNLEAYLQLIGDWPITKINFTYQDYPEKNSDFISRPIALDESLEKTIQEIKVEAERNHILFPQSTTPVVKHSAHNASSKRTKKPQVLEL